MQGRKQVTVGGERYIHDPSQYLAVSVDLPAVGNVLEATPEEPYLCMTLKVDPRELAALIVETGRRAPRDDHDGRGIYVSALQAPLLDGFLRLVRLLDTPDDVSVLAPLILRELHYRLLQSGSLDVWRRWQSATDAPALGTGAGSCKFSSVSRIGLRLRRWILRLVPEHDE